MLGLPDDGVSAPSGATRRHQPPKRALLAWDLGQNFGHIERLLTIAPTLIGAGAAVDFAFSQPELLQGRSLPDGANVLQSPAPPHLGFAGARPVNLFDILRNFGYADAAALKRNVDQWLAIFAANHTAALIADYAPSALLAARIARIPVLALDWGFWLPPAETPLTDMRAAHHTPANERATIEREVLRSVNHVLRAHHDYPLASLADVYRWATACRLTFAELDYYPQREPVHYHGILPGPPRATHAVWAEREGPRVFVYLHRDSAAVRACLAALTRAHCRFAVVGSIVSAAPLAELLPADTLVFPDGVDISAAGAQADLAVTHASHGVSSEVLWRGCPLLMLPNQAEQLMLAERIERLGCGTVVQRSPTPTEADAMAADLVHSPMPRAAALRFAARYRGHEPSRILDAVASWWKGLAR